MATTKIKKNTKEEVKANTNVVVKKSLIRGPRITEKGAMGAEKGIYTFNVEKNATKSELKKVIKAMYKVTPVKIAITQITAKSVFIRGKKGTKQGGKKAVVYLKKGDKIEFV
jgi:large subunit ribosomal protein L23